MTATPDMILIPPFPTPAEASKGSPRNGCGWCRHVVDCPLGRRFFPDTPAPCPAIIQHDGKVRRGFVVGEPGLMETNAATEPLVRRMLGIGEGCRADDPAEAA